jgi:hypothetical protein
MINSYFVTGFTEGEGSFYVGILPRNLEKVKWEVRPSFSLSQNKENDKVLFKLKEFFGCGFIRPSKKDNTLKYETRSLIDLKEKIIPHFDKYSLEGNKQKDFLLFRDIVKSMEKNEHLTKEGLMKIVNEAILMAKSPKRVKSLKRISALLKV